MIDNNKNSLFFSALIQVHWTHSDRASAIVAALRLANACPPASDDKWFNASSRKKICSGNRNSFTFTLRDLLEDPA